MTLRTAFFWLHLTAGIVAGAIVLLMSVTGVALTYERQMIAWSDREFKSSPRPGVERMPVARLVEEFRRQNPGQAPTAVVVEAASAEPVTVSVAQRTVYLDAYSGRVLGTANQGMRQMMSNLRAWHRWLAIEGPGRTTARAITGWANVLFLFIVASGIYMWFPRRWTWQTVKAVLLFRPGLRGKARDFNWHNVIGIWSSVPLLIVVASAVPISFPWGTALVYRMVGEEPPVRGGGGGRGAGEAAEGRGRAGRPAPSFEGLSPLLARAKSQEPDWRTISLRLPSAPDAPVVFAIDRGDGGQPHLRSTLTLTRAGAVVSYESFDRLTTGRRIRNVMRFAHTGEVLGLAGQTLAGVVSAGGVVLAWTGIALALRRFRAWIKRRRTQELEPASLENPAA